MKKAMFLPMFIVILLVLPMVSSFGPHTHNYVIDQLKDRSDESEVLSTCLDGGINEEAFRAGSVISDITVVYYWIEGGKNYKSSHNWNFQQEIMSRAVTEDQRCFAWGVAEHLIADDISHTMMVPSAIEKTNIQNAFTHPLIEKKMDSVLVADHPELMEESRNMLNAMYGIRGEKYISMIEYALGENSIINVKKETDNLAWALDSFYTKAFSPKVQDNSLFVIYPYIDKLTNFIHPLVGKWNVGETYTYADKTVELSINTYNNWGARYTLSPHGFSELQKADNEAGNMVTYILISIILLFTGFPMYLVWKKKKFKYAFLILLVIPAIILAITIVYIIL